MFHDFSLFLKSLPMFWTLAHRLWQQMLLKIIFGGLWLTLNALPSSHWEPIWSANSTQTANEPILYTFYTLQNYSWI